jgi:hypothetical protein
MSHPIPPSAPAASADELLYQNELLHQGYTPGLIFAVTMNCLHFLKSFWIIDDSGSMQTQDGQRIITNRKDSKLKFATCTRWKETVEAVDYHARLAALTHAPTTYRLLNHPGRNVGSQIFSIASTNDTSQHTVDRELCNALNTMNQTQAGGVTPLTEHLVALKKEVASMDSQLCANGQRVAIVLLTDGIPTDKFGNSTEQTHREFMNALNYFRNYPVWIVVRLCTDEESVVRYWNELDEDLEVCLEVLDDYVSEGKEVYEKNPWLTYGLPIHRMREMGFYNPLLDLLDERAFTKSEISDFVRILFGNFDAPDPDLNWDQFCKTVEQVQNQQFNNVKQWHPVHRKLAPWIDIKQLRRHRKSRFALW